MSSPDGLPASPLLRLPLEIRLIIYEYLLLPSITPSSSYSTSVNNVSSSSHHLYLSPDTNATPTTLSVRTIDPYMGAHTRTWRRRTTYHTRSGPFLTSTTPTTYRVLLSPYTAHLRHTVPSLLPLNRQIHAEAARVLYGAYTFAFDAHVEAVVPFLADRTPVARACVRALHVVRKALPYTKEFDRAEWAHFCEYVAGEVCLRRLGVGVVVGREEDESLEGEGEGQAREISAEEFRLMARMRREWGGGVAGVDLEWAEQLMQIKGLREMDVRAVREYCPVPRGEGMEFWKAFGRSVEGGFAEWVMGAMVG
ncbi:hypothetical protein BS50DRAFT_634285 [Corynespora cassiicola Philippines]|uniref:F-box domain-containing protein n=1 Tax=Corynespora cassiicola Philippines TaxID=1448308 RepID=A0A2T2NN20_CORCC|nr:hypothetical protein BS50DRAFT_634285 [Corynespora cassiicola Philippines]